MQIQAGRLVEDETSRRNWKPTNEMKSRFNSAAERLGDVFKTQDSTGELLGKFRGIADRGGLGEASCYCYKATFSKSKKWECG